MTLIQFRTVAIPIEYDVINPYTYEKTGEKSKVRNFVKQYRERQNIHEIGLHEPIWGEWINVDSPILFG